MKISLLLTGVVLGSCICGTAWSDTITVNRLFREDIWIPHFDQSLGILESVDLKVTMHRGQTTSASHFHNQISFFSSNYIPRPLGSFLPFVVVLEDSGGHTHQFASPDYGMGIGSFSGATELDGEHNHAGIVRYIRATDFGERGYLVAARIQRTSPRTHVHAIAEQTKKITYTGSDLAAFLGSRDIRIPAGEFEFGSQAAHAHAINSFSTTIDTVEGPRTVEFAARESLPSGFHTHSLTSSRFSVSAVFDFTVVPEPASSSLVVLVLACTFGRTGRHRRVAGVAAKRSPR